jgi:protocatechuate 3,4-dioxygenase beta subunit
MLPPAPAETPAPATGSAAISGVVIDAVTGTPLPNTLVVLGNQGRGTLASQSRQLTDEKGRFVFVNLPASESYTVTGSRFGYLDGGYVQENAAGGSAGLVVVREAEWVKDTRITMSRPGAIGGTVVDERGEPVVGVYVRALSRVRIQGRDELAAGPLTTTDDRGMYRVSGLGPGKYVVQVPSVQASVPAGTQLASGRGGASEAALEVGAETRLVIGRYPIPPPPAAGRAMAYPITFHPGTPSAADAVSVDLQRGEERTGVDIRLSPVPTARVSGTVDGPPEALTRLTLRLLPAGLENLGQGSESATALVGADGRFAFFNVPAGAYVLDAPRSMSELTTGPTSMLTGGVNFNPPPGTTGWGSMSQGLDSAPPGTSFTTRDFRSDTAGYSGRTALVVAGRDISNVVVPLKRGATMSGRMVTEPDPSKPAPALPLTAMLDPANGSPSLGLPRSTYSPDNTPGEFTIQGVTPGEYFLRASGSSWLVKSIQWRGRDYTDAPFDTSAVESFTGVVMTLTNAAPVLTGTVREPNGTPASGATVIVFPADRAGWTSYGLTPSRIKSTFATNVGTFRLSTLPAGDYYVVALEGSPPSVWQEPEFFRSVENLATRVKLSWAGQSTQDLTTTQVR